MQRPMNRALVGAAALALALASTAQAQVGLTSNTATVTLNATKTRRAGRGCGSGLERGDGLHQRAGRVLRPSPPAAALRARRPGGRVPAARPVGGRDRAVAGDRGGREPGPRGGDHPAAGSPGADGASARAAGRARRRFTGRGDVGARERCGVAERRHAASDRNDRGDRGFAGSPGPVRARLADSERRLVFIFAKWLVIALGEVTSIARLGHRARVAAVFRPGAGRMLRLRLSGRLTRGFSRATRRGHAPRHAPFVLHG